jgi:two-component system response regulator NreC
MRESVPETKVVILTIHEDPAYLRQVLEAGGAGYVVKRAVDIELIGAIRAVGRGERYVHPFMTDALVNIALGKEEGTPEGEHGLGALSRREREVLHLVVMGHSYQRIAERLRISVKTVETHRARVMEKLGLRTRADLVQYALRHGFMVQDIPSDRR